MSSFLTKVNALKGLKKLRFLPETNFGVKPVPTIFFLGIKNLFLGFKDFLPKNL